MNLIDYKINNNWRDFFLEQFKQEYFKSLSQYIDDQYNNSTIYPPKDKIFSAFEMTDINDINLVILGQDPYHKKNQAMGLSFSVPFDVKIPPSLRNIYKEIEEELLISMPESGDLTSWSQNGVFLLNTVLTVRAGEAFSHRNKGWETFTDNAISYIDSQKRPICYMLWGNSAKSKRLLIKNPDSMVLEAAHPSPLSANKGFFGCNHFLLYRDFLEKNYGLSLKCIE